MLRKETLNRIYSLLFTVIQHKQPAWNTRYALQLACRLTRFPLPNYQGILLAKSLPEFQYIHILGYHSKTYFPMTISMPANLAGELSLVIPVVRMAQITT